MLSRRAWCSAGVILCSLMVTAAAGAGLYPSPPPDFAHPASPHAPQFSIASGTNDRPLLVVYVQFTDFATPIGRATSAGRRALPLRPRRGAATASDPASNAPPLRPHGPSGAAKLLDQNLTNGIRQQNRQRKPSFCGGKYGRYWARTSDPACRKWLSEPERTSSVTIVATRLPTFSAGVLGGRSAREVSRTGCADGRRTTSTDHG